MRILRAGMSSKITSCPSRCLKTHGGFTLIELTVALFLISVIMGLALPRLGNFLYSSDLKHSLRQLRAILSVARSSAASERIPRRVVCDISNGKISIEKELREEGEGQVIVDYEKDNSVLIRTYKLPKGVQMQDVLAETGEKETDGTAYLRIDTTGIITGNIIHLSKGEQLYTVFINPLTGRITLEEGYFEEYKVAEKHG